MCPTFSPSFIPLIVSENFRHMRRMLLGLSEPLSTLVKSKCKAAKDNGSLTFTSSEQAIITSSKGVSFQVRFCPSLAKKPQPKHDSAKDTPKKPFNPFENPDTNLLVTSIPTDAPAYNIVLNKYPIIPNHFILSTKQFKLQTDDLEQDDLATTYACLNSWEDRNDSPTSTRLFAFFNSGEFSGASQPHRHIQFLPVESVLEGFGKDGWIGQIKAFVGDGEFPNMPIKVFKQSLRNGIDPSEIHEIYKRLLQNTRAAYEQYAARKGLALENFSYNIGMSTSLLVLCPRISEGEVLRGEDGEEIGFAALNGSILSGGVLLKKEKEWDLVRRNSDVLDYILESIGVPVTSDAVI